MIYYNITYYNTLPPARGDRGRHRGGGRAPRRPGEVLHYMRL